MATKCEALFLGLMRVRVMIGQRSKQQCDLPVTKQRRTVTAECIKFGMNCKVLNLIVLWLLLEEAVVAKRQARREYLF